MRREVGRKRGWRGREWGKGVGRRRRRGKGIRRKRRWRQRKMRRWTGERGAEKEEKGGRKK